MKIYVWLSFYDVINDGQVHIWSSGWRRSRHPLRYKYGPAHHWSPSRTTTKRKFSSFIIFHMHRMIGLIKFQHLIWKKIMIFKCLQNKEAWDISPIILNKLAHKSCFFFLQRAAAFACVYAPRQSHTRDVRSGRKMRIMQSRALSRYCCHWWPHQCWLKFYWIQWNAAFLIIYILNHSHCMWKVDFTSYCP